MNQAHIRLPKFFQWSVDRIRLKHNWFDHLPRIIEITESGAPIPKNLERWNSDYSALFQWLGNATDALSPKQVLDLDVFEAWPDEFLNCQKEELHERFLKAPSHIEKVVQNCQEKLKKIDEVLKPHLKANIFSLGKEEKKALADLFNEVITELHRLPERVGWPEPARDSLPQVLVIDDLLGRSTMKFPRASPINGDARQQLQEIRRSFCQVFRLVDADETGSPDPDFNPVARAHFCSGQKWDNQRGFTNDLKVVKQFFFHPPKGIDSSQGWALVLVDVHFNTGQPDLHGQGETNLNNFGLDSIVPWLCEEHPDVPTVVMTTASSKETITQVQQYEVEYLQKSSASHQSILDQIVKGEKATTAQLRAAMKIPPTFIAEDPKMIKVLFDAWIAAQDPDGKTVLILGPTGTGKEELSKFIHKMSPRAGGPFEFINCAQLNPELADSELFGHYKGGFSGAVYKDTDGLFHRMDGGTLVLDEFADLPDLVQNKLLRTLSPECAQDREIRPVGNKLPHSTLRTKVNTRIICCTSKNLSPLRSDLVHRVTSIQIVIPSLQNRPQDILPLARHFLRAPGLELDKSACDFLLKAQFNGNVRMLRTVVEAAAKTKGKRNILHGSDLKQVYDRIQESNPVEPGPNQSAPNAPSSVGPIRTPQIEKPGSISTLPEAVACLLELQSTGSNWNDLTKSQFESIDMILRGQIFNVLSILVEWGLFRTKDLPELCRYLNGSEKKGRSPEDLVKKLLKLDEKIPNHLAQSPYRKTDNGRLTDLIDEITATKKRK